MPPAGPPIGQVLKWFQSAYRSTLRALIACTAPMLWMFSVFEGEFVKANNAGSRKNQSFEIPIRLIVLEIFNLRAC